MYNSFRWETVSIDGYNKRCSVWKVQEKTTKTEWVKIGDVWILGKVTEGRFSGGSQGFKANKKCCQQVAGGEEG